MGYTPLLSGLVVCFVWMFISSGMVIEITAIFIMLVFSYLIATSSQKFYALVPVSKKYALLNLYLIPLVFAVILCFALWAAIMLLVLLAFGTITLIGGPQDAAAPPSVVLPTSAGAKTVLFCILLALIALLAITAISVIRRKKIRRIALWSFLIVLSGLLVWLKVSLPAVPSDGAITILSFGFDSVLPGFEQLPSAWAIVICMAAALIVIAPISVRFAYRAYMRDVSKKND